MLTILDCRDANLLTQKKQTEYPKSRFLRGKSYFHENSTLPLAWASKISEKYLALSLKFMGVYLYMFLCDSAVFMGLKKIKMKNCSLRF